MARKGVGINFSKNALNALSIKVNLNMKKKKKTFFIISLYLIR